MAKNIATRDIKFGSIDGERWIKAGDEIPDGQLKDFPAGTYRTIDESTFPGGKCPTCGTVVASTQGQNGVPAEVDDDPPSTRRETLDGDAARQAAIDSMKRRPDNADSGLPSFGKIPIDVEQSFVQGRATMRTAAVPQPASAAPVVNRDPQGRVVPPTTEQRRQAADKAPKPDANAPNMGGFGGDKGGDATGGPSTQTAQTEHGTGADQGQGQPQGQQAPVTGTNDTGGARPTGGGRGAANKP